MKKPTKSPRKSDVESEYDFGRAVRGKYAKRYAKGTNVVILSPDVAEHFSTSAAVNKALREVVRRIRKKPA